MPGSQVKPRRWTVIASGLLCGGLALVVLFTNRAAFFSPLAVVVVSAIGLAAVLLQLGLHNRNQSSPVRSPVWLNVLSVMFALAAFVGDLLNWNSLLVESLALAAVGGFAISGTVILRAFRKQRAVSK